MVFCASRETRFAKQASLSVGMPFMGIRWHRRIPANTPGNRDFDP
jgi:hypothetical protein